MFASRTCRMSIMVGIALNQAHLKKVDCHIGELSLNPRTVLTADPP